jgi:hypothetical protein
MPRESVDSGHGLLETGAVPAVMGTGLGLGWEEGAIISAEVEGKLVTDGASAVIGAGRGVFETFNGGTDKAESASDIVLTESCGIAHAENCVDTGISEVINADDSGSDGETIEPSDVSPVVTAAVADCSTSAEGSTRGVGKGRSICISSGASIRKKSVRPPLPRRIHA